MNQKLISLILLSIVLLPLVSSWNPESHNFISTTAFERSPNSAVGLIIQNNWDDFMAGCYMTDASIFYYLEEGINSISSKYKSTHSPSFCKRAVALAHDDSSMAFALGLCVHMVQDSVAHTDFVPKVISKSKLVNVLVHALAEEKVNDILKTPELTAELRSQLVNTAPIHKEFFLEVVGADLGDINVGAMYEAFIQQVSASDKYSVGFKSFSAIPFSIHITLILFFLSNTVLLAFLIRRKKKNIFNKISMVILSMFILSTILIYVLFYTGKLWVFYQWASYPLSQILPTSGWEQSIEKSISNTVQFFNVGASYMNTVPDPSGEVALIEAGKAGLLIRWILNIFLISLVGLFVWLNFRRKKNG